MRLLLLVVILVLAFGTLGFMATNPSAKVSVRVLNTVYEEAHVGYVVIFSVLAGAIGIGVVAVGEGARIRFENRRLRRELNRLESELHFLRTQPAALARSEPDDPVDGSGPESGGAGDGTDDIAQAPVYEPSENQKRWPPDPDDDAYSGGSAV